jgi:predicted phosphodiesterase
VKLHILSDLHLEFGDFDVPVTDADVIVLAGDIWQSSRGLHWARRRFPETEIVYVLGNHEFYGGEFYDVLSACRRAAADTRVHFMENDGVNLGGVRFVGAALWTDFRLFGNSRQGDSMLYAQSRMNDFHAVEIHDAAGRRRRFAPQDVVPLHEESRAFLERELAQAFNGKTVVVTHHLPSPSSVAARFVADPLTPCFCSNLNDLIVAAAPDVWVHGHTHDSFDYRIGRTRIVCNPRGYYPDELNPKFEPELIIEV